MLISLDLALIKARREHPGQVVFDGNVEIFQIEGNDQANVAYGWGWDAGSGEIDYIGILHVPPIESAREAVKAAIASGQFG